MKILTDISFSSSRLGLSGIPQDSRWLFKTLSEIKDVDVSAFIYDHGETSNVLIHNFKEDKFFSQIQYFVSGYSKPGTGDLLQELPWKRWKRVLHYIYSIYYKPTFKLEKVHEFFKPLIYRTFLAKGNVPYKLMLKDFYIYHFSIGALVSRTINNLNGPKINTKGYDFALFQDARSFRVSKGTTKIIRYHDSIPLTDPDVMTNAKNGSAFHYFSIKKCVNDSSVFVTNSDTVNRKLVSIFPKLKGRTYTINYAISDKFYPELKKIPFRYILHVATIEPRKNQVNLIKAYKKVREKYPELKLVIVGQKGWKYEEIEEEMKSLGKDLLYIDGLTPDELRVFYSNAEMFVFPSLNEGFGLPPVEAMACGCPVLSSNIDVHVEIQKEAATYCDPYDPNDIAEKMIYIIENSEYAKDKITLGFNVVKRYSNERAKENWSSLLNLLTDLYGKDHKKQQNSSKKKTGYGSKGQSRY